MFNRSLHVCAQSPPINAQALQAAVQHNQQAENKNPYATSTNLNVHLFFHF